MVVHPDGMILLPHHDSSYSMFDACCNAGLKKKKKRKNEKAKKIGEEFLERHGVISVSYDLFTKDQKRSEIILNE